MFKTFFYLIKYYSLNLEPKYLTEQYFPVIVFVMLYKVVLSFEFVNEIIKCDYSNQSY